MSKAINTLQTKEEFIAEIKSARKVTNEWRNKCISLRAELWILKKQLSAMADNITTNDKKWDSSIHYNSGGNQSIRKNRGKVGRARAALKSP